MTTSRADQNECVVGVDSPAKAGRSGRLKRLPTLIACAALLTLVLVGCAAPAPTPETIVQEVTRVVVETEVVEVPAEPTEKTVVEFWTTDNEEDRVDTYEAVAADYMAMHPEVDIRIVPIEEGGILQRIATAQAANRLPDIVRMGVEQVAAFAADGILDEDAAEAVIASISEDDFRASPLAMVTDPATGKRAAVPFDGWIQAIWYRAEVFDGAGRVAGPLPLECAHPLMLLARLQAIDQALYEAAEVDGAGALKKFLYVTLPELRYVLGAVFLLRLMWTFNKFDDIYLLTGGGFGTKVLPVLTYEFSFRLFDFGRGAATAMILLVLLVAFMLIYVRLVMRTVEE